MGVVTIEIHNPCLLKLKLILPDLIVSMQLTLEMTTSTDIDLSHSRQFDLSGVTNNINDASVPFRWPSKWCQ